MLLTAAAVADRRPFLNQDDNQEDCPPTNGHVSYEQRDLINLRRLLVMDEGMTHLEIDLIRNSAEN